MLKPNEAVRGVIFDLSGTVIDHGSRGPVVAFAELFARHGVEVSEAEARKPMGAHKRDHIRAMLGEPAIAERWLKATGREPGEDVLDSLYAEFTPLQIEVLERHSDVLPGVPEMTDELRRRGVRFASTTGFDSGMIGGLKRRTTAGGYSPEIIVCPDMAGGGRPAPWMAFHAARHMGIYPMRHIVKVGDTAADVAEAHNAGMWAVAVVATGNEIGLSSEQLAALPAGERQQRFDAVRRKFERLGAHYIIDAAASLAPVLDAVNERLARGERP
jgi:phosphonoacetaldehyde hydrolase